MSDGKAKVVAHAPGERGEISDLATHIKDTTGATCVALVMIDPSGNGSYTVTGSLEAHLPMPDVREKVVRALRTQLSGPVQ